MEEIKSLDKTTLHQKIITYPNIVFVIVQSDAGSLPVVEKLNQIYDEKNYDHVKFFKIEFSQNNMAALSLENKSDPPFEIFFKDGVRVKTLTFYTDEIFDETLQNIFGPPQLSPPSSPNYKSIMLSLSAPTPKSELLKQEITGSESTQEENEALGKMDMDFDTELEPKLLKLESECKEVTLEDLRSEIPDDFIKRTPSEVVDEMEKIHESLTQAEREIESSVNIIKEVQTIIETEQEEINSIRQTHSLEKVPPSPVSSRSDETISYQEKKRISIPSRSEDKIGYQKKFCYLILNTLAFFLLGLTVFPMIWLWAISDQCSFFKSVQMLLTALTEDSVATLLRHGAICTVSMPIRPT